MLIDGTIRMHSTLSKELSSKPMNGKKQQLHLLAPEDMQITVISPVMAAADLTPTVSASHCSSNRGPGPLWCS